MEKIFYFAQVLGAVNTLALAALVIALLAFVVVLIYYCSEYADYDEDCKEAKACKRWCRKLPIVAVISALVLTFVPNKQTYLFMVGGNALEEIAKNEKVQETAGKTLELFNQYLDGKLDKGEEDE